jgi:hypothetical protein
MPDHWHLVVWPQNGQDRQVLEFLRWLTVTRTAYGSLRSSAWNRPSVPGEDLLSPSGEPQNDSSPPYPRPQVPGATANDQDQPKRHEEQAGATRSKRNDSGSGTTAAGPARPGRPGGLGGPGATRGSPPWPAGGTRGVMTGGPPSSASPSIIRQNRGCQCSNRAGWACQRFSQYFDGGLLRQQVAENGMEMIELRRVVRAHVNHLFVQVLVAQGLSLRSKGGCLVPTDQ